MREGGIGVQIRPLKNLDLSIHEEGENVVCGTWILQTSYAES